MTTTPEIPVNALTMPILTQAVRQLAALARDWSPKARANFAERIAMMIRGEA